MNERERAIEARVNAATPGQWYRDTHPQEPIIASRTEGETWYSIAPVCQVCYGDWTEGDAEFIAAAPADIRYLLARVRELEEALAYRDQDVEIAMQVIFDITGLHSLYDVHDMFRSRSKAICLENNIGSVRWRGNPNPPKREDNRNE